MRNLVSHFFCLSIILLITSPIFSQQTGKKASLDEDGQVQVTNIQLPVNSDKNEDNFEILDGFPFGSPANATFKNFRGAAVADIDEDGQDEIIFGANSKLFVLKGNGSVLWSRNLSGTLIYPPSVADMDGDGTFEIILNTGGSPNAGRVYLMDKDGNDLPGWPQNFDQHWMFNAPAIADLDGDDIMEVVTCERGNSTSGFLHVIKLDGTELNENWPLELPGNLAFTPSIGDINNDGSEDIVIAISSGSLYAINTDGSFLDGFPVVETNRSYSYQSPILFEFDQGEPGHLSIVGARHGDVSDYYIINSDGSYADGWPITNPTGWRYSPATVIKANNQGVPAIFFGHPNTNGSFPLNVIFSYNYAGELFNNFPISKIGGCESVISVSDADGDGIRDIIFTSNITDASGYGYIHAYSLEDGEELDGFPLRPKGFTFMNSAIVGDFDGDGLRDLACLSYTQFTGADSIFITAYNLGIPNHLSDTYANGYKGNQKRDGRVDMSTTLNLDNLIGNELTISCKPNPASKFLQIQWNQYIEKGSIFIYDYMGQLVDVQNVGQNQNLNMDVSRFASGQYIIQLMSTETQISTKWIKIN